MGVRITAVFKMTVAAAHSNAQEVTPAYARYGGIIGNNFLIEHMAHPQRSRRKPCCNSRRAEVLGSCREQRLRGVLAIYMVSLAKARLSSLNKLGSSTHAEAHRIHLN